MRKSICRRIVLAAFAMAALTGGAFAAVGAQTQPMQIESIRCHGSGNINEPHPDCQKD
jgi:hypothetical protein